MHDRSVELAALLRDRILILDGAMGTMIQRAALSEADFRGDRFRHHPQDLKGNSDILCLTRPDVIAEIHRQYLEAGADIIETNTFTATSVSQAEYGLPPDLSYEINVEAARIARAEAAAFSAQNPKKPRFVAGSIGSTTHTLSMSREVDNPAARSLPFDALKDSYAQQVRGLIDGGVDILLVETVIDTLNAKAAIAAIMEAFDARQTKLPVMVSMTIPDQSGRTLSGQTVEAFWISVAHIKPLTIGINCALGAAEMRPYIQELSRVAPIFVHCYPNAGLPNEFAQYDQTPHEISCLLEDFARQGWVNILGGCCGTTPEHIRHIAQHIEGAKPRVPPTIEPWSRYSGLVPFTIRPETGFVMIGERTNVTGSARFAKLIRQAQYEEALAVARQQIEGGANIIDVNMDEGLLDSAAAMTTFLRLIASEPDIATVPVMIDSSKFEVIEAGLKCVQGKSIVNSISLKEGEEAFKKQAKIIQKYGAAAVVMAFDEHGQATDTPKRIAIAQRAFRILTEELGFDPSDILFDPNILAIATGIDEHNDYARSFIESTARIKSELPHVKIVGGVSNLSFAFRGNEPIRQTMHSVFLYHAIRAGMDMGIVNAGQLAVYEDIPPALKNPVEDVILNRANPDNENPTERLVTIAQSLKSPAAAAAATSDAAWRSGPLQDRLAHALRHGVLDHLEADIDEALRAYPKPLDIIEGPLMAGMNIVGDLFGSGKMFLPQVVKSARVMKRAVAILSPHFDQTQKARSAGKILLATVKGDVHDIGKNIVGVVLACNNYEILDLGVMVPCDKILDTAARENVDLIGLSGLITPSLDEMAFVAAEMERRNMKTPLLIGGATTSKRHTAVKIAPRYSHLTVHVNDASRAPSACGRLMDPAQREVFAAQLLGEYTKEQEIFAKRNTARALLSLANARKNAAQIDWSNPPDYLQKSPPTGLQTLAVSLDTLIRYIDWSPFFATWQLKGAYPNILNHPDYGATARELFDHAQTALQQLASEGRLQAKGVFGFFPAASDGDDIVVYDDDTHQAERLRLNMLRQQKVKAGEEQANLCLSDFVAPVAAQCRDHVAAFAVTAGLGLDDLLSDADDYTSILYKSLADRLAEAFAEYIHERIRDAWGVQPAGSLPMEALLKEQYQGIRPAFGYPACPDHTEKTKLFSLLDATNNTGITLTEHFAMYPTASVSGLVFAHPAAHYFTVSPIGRDQVEDYARRKNTSIAEVERWLGSSLAYTP